jgi:hypothetical protein
VADDGGTVDAKLVEQPDGVGDVVGDDRGAGRP